VAQVAFHLEIRVEAEALGLARLEAAAECAVWRAVEAITTAARSRSGKVAAQLSACIPPIDPPTTAASVAMPRWSSSIACARTMSRMVMTGTVIAYSRPVAGSMLAGPEEPMQLPSTLAHTTKKRSVSIGLPGPTIRCHQPGLPVRGCGLARCWSPVSAWQTRMALDASAASVP
jgi:hypothetical protein